MEIVLSNSKSAHNLYTVQHNLKYYTDVCCCGKINIFVSESTYLELVQNGHQWFRFVATSQKLL